MASMLIKIVVFVGIVATIGINVMAPRLGVEHTPAATSPPPAFADGPRLIPVPPGMR